MQLLSPSYIEERDGELYAGATRVPVRTLVVAWTFHRDTPEQIAESYPSVPLATVYGVIAYYLDHQTELDARFAHDDDEFERQRLAQYDDPNSFASELRRRVQALHARSTDEGKGSVEGSAE